MFTELFTPFSHTCIHTLFFLSLSLSLSLSPSPSPSLPPSPSPSLPLPLSLSKEVVDRPYYRDLLDHPLIKEYESKDVDIGQWFRDIIKTIGPH